MNDNTHLNKIQKDITKDLKLNGLEEYDNLVNNFVKILNDALEKKQEQINYWKRKAYILFQLYHQCPEHDTHHERTFDIWQAIKDKECKTCEAQQIITERSKK